MSSTRVPLGLYTNSTDRFQPNPVISTNHNAYSANISFEEPNTYRLMCPSVQLFWLYRYDAYNKSSVVYPPVLSSWLHRSESNSASKWSFLKSFQPNKPNPYKWVNPNLRKGPLHDHTHSRRI